MKDIELEEMRAQINLLKEMLDKQSIVNNHLLPIGSVSYGFDVNLWSISSFQSKYSAYLSIISYVKFKCQLADNLYQSHLSLNLSKISRVICSE